MLIGAYALGKAQRIMALLREAGYNQPVYLHGALQKLTSLYEKDGGYRLVRGKQQQPIYR